MSLALAYSALVLSFLAAAPLVWISLFLLWWQGIPVLPREPRRVVPWGLIDLVVGFFLLLGLSAAGVSQFFPKKPAEEPVVEQRNRLEKVSLDDARKSIALDSGIKLATAVLLVVIIAVRLRPSADDWGWTLAHWRRDLLLGVVTFLAIYAPMIGLQAALVFGLGWKYDHPFINLVTQTKDPLLFGLTAIAATIVAPLFEEFAIRGLWQGWLEKLFSGAAGPKSLLLGGPDDERPFAKAFENAMAEPASPQPVPDAGFGDSPPVQEESSSAAMVEPALVPATGFDWLAIVVSMLVFSLLHYSHGPAWIPLLIFGAAVGFVYQRTHRLWPGIIAHMLLNTTTMVGLGVQVFGNLPPP
jgi:membrane protease YdiL (CAAX protease family)